MKKQPELVVSVKPEAMSEVLCQEFAVESEKLIKKAKIAIACHDDLVAAAIRMFVGVTGKDTYGCEWYEGIEQDAAEELSAALAKAGVA